MKEIQQPKKQPEMIKKRIIEQAIILAAEKGTAGVSIQHVANAVGISKGGVFHHFANKQLLIEAMIDEIIFHLDGVIDCLVQNDPIAYGCFTRAYIHTTLMSQVGTLVSPWSALCMTLISDRTFNSHWGQWLGQRLLQHHQTDADLSLALLRLAVDGLWLQHMTGIVDAEACLTLKNHLINKTYLNP